MELLHATRGLFKGCWGKRYNNMYCWVHSGAILRLFSYLRAWNTQAMIAKELGVSQPTIVRILDEFIQNGHLPEMNKSRDSHHFNHLASPQFLAEMRIGTGGQAYSRTAIGGVN